MGTQVSVCIISYNHAKYFRETIESVLVQRCSFEFEIIVCDDHSTDGTEEIIKEYAAKYPTLIKAYYSENNTGMHRNWARALKLCTGKYIALLESDDYWNDSMKLQKQYDILEKNPEVVASFTEAHIIYENNADGYPWYVQGKKEIYTREDIIINNLMPTCTVLMRNNISDNFFPPTYYKSPFADWMIHFQSSLFGNFHFLNEPTSTYRVHSKGVWGGIDEEKQLLNRLKANDCMYKTATAPDIRKSIREARISWLQKICHHYKCRSKYLQYAKFRIELLLN
ncbi:MAG: glycosyltransferase [Bacteroidetes bacterium]|nr:glycosyltransferase [Bacteroidota bacterium]